jgi:hypothetical protein
MVAFFQALLRLLLVALAAIGTWAGVELDLPGAPSEAERQAAARELREHSADVFARIEEIGIAEPSSLPSVAAAEDAQPAAPAPTQDLPAAPPTKPVIPAAAPAPVPLPLPVPIIPEPTPQPDEDEPEPTWIETKLPETLYDPVDGAADEADEDIDDEALARKTTVNLACVRREGAALRITSGSGVVISPDGLIATNAHVAYQFLLAEDGIGCSITHPSYPVFGYPGQLVYISPDWIKKNSAAIGGTRSTSSGEGDYAFVAFAPGSAPTSLGSLTFAPVRTDEPVAKVGDKILVAGYPGAAATPEGYGASSRLKTDEVSVEDVDSFSGKTADIVQTGRTAVAESGSSGGGAFQDGSLIGLTVTIYRVGSGYGVNALSMAWVNRNLRANEGVSIADLIAEDPDAAAESFWAEHGEDLADRVRAALD